MFLFPEVEVFLIISYTGNVRVPVLRSSLKSQCVTFRDKTADLIRPWRRV